MHFFDRCALIIEDEGFEENILSIEEECSIVLLRDTRYFGKIDCQTLHFAK